jgi:hypothetical protein
VSGLSGVLHCCVATLMPADLKTDLASASPLDRCPDIVASMSDLTHLRKKMYRYCTVPYCITSRPARDPAYCSAQSSDLALAAVWP